MQFAFNKFLAQGYIDVLHDHEIMYGGRMVNVHIHLKAAVGADSCWLFTKFIRSTEVSGPPN